MIQLKCCFEPVFYTFYRAYANVGAPAIFLHSDIIMPYVSKYGTAEQRDKYIPAMTAGTCVSSIAMTEPDAGR